MIMVRELTNEEVVEVALNNGFKLKQQPDGEIALNPYVFDFVRALFEAARVQQTTERDDAAGQ